MRSKSKLIGLVLVIVLIIIGVAWGLSHYNFAVLNPAGEVGMKQRNLMIAASLLSLLVVLPVFTLLGVFAWKYRDTNKKPGKYTPDSDGDSRLEILWWSIPAVLLVVLSVIIWRSSHDLDPYKPLVSEAKPVQVQVIALEWKWLFIYPEEGVASVNTLALPVNTPVNFTITSDAPMNSFWIPQLGGQVYAMTGMSTKLHLIADKAGAYDGSSANISGEGFAGMTFKAHALNEADYLNWLDAARGSGSDLDDAAYDALAKPSQNVKPAVYAYRANGLYDRIIMKYMAQEKPNKTHQVEAVR